MEPICPTCHSAIDPARAPAARVRGARVVTYCSDRCADLAPLDIESEAPAPVDATPAPAPVRAAPPVEPVVTSPAVEPVAMAPAESDGGAEPEAPVERRDSLRSAPRDHEAAPRRSPLSLQKWQLVAGCSIALIVGMGMVAIEACPSSTPVRAAYEEKAAPARSAAGEREGAPTPAVAAEPESRAISPERLLASATTTLRALLDSPSERLQRLAAMALARAADPAAMDHLRGLLDTSTSDLVKLQISYALARAGDATGRDLLTTSLKAKARDTRLDAARFLAQLGDEHAGKVLRNLLGYRAFRISAAGLLARLGDQKGVDALREVLDGKRSSMELRMRAAVELGRAGDASVHDRLVEILDGGQYQVGAALALAALGDHSAVPALGHLLGLDSFRVRAALGLRRMGEKVDLEPLAGALANGNEVTQVTAAEAILILVGPETAAEHD